MIDRDYPKYDFLNASKVERPLAAALKIWMNKFTEMFPERWKELAPTPIKVTMLPIDSLRFDAAQGRWSQPSIGVPIRIKVGAVNGMIVAPQVDMLILIMEILTESLSKKPVHRELTTIEQSLCELFLEQSLLSFGEAWPDKEILPTELGEIDRQPNRCRLMMPDREVLVTGFQISTSSSQAIGPVRIEWMFAKDEMKKLLGVPDQVVSPANSGEKIPTDNIYQIYVEISARLGSAELGMDDLLQLDAGDIVKLNQKIEKPLVLNVNDQPTFDVWPGRVGDQQCFQIESIIC